MRKEEYEQYFKDKKITVMGLGLLGRGIGDTAFLARSGSTLCVTDKKDAVALSASLEALKEYSDIAFHLGGHVFEDFENKDFILKAAGVPYDSEYIAYAERHDVPVFMSAALLSRIVMNQCPGTIVIGITGTRGKTTATELIAHILRETHSRVHVGGNIRGIANLPLLDEIEDGDFLVLELDSWQLQGFGAMKISPHVAVFTSFLDDHMNYYKNDKDLYFKDKSYIYANQEDGDVLIASKEVADVVTKNDKRHKVLVPEEMQFEMSLIGEHNQTLATLAYEVGVQCGLDDESIRAAIKSFKAAPGRLQDLGLFATKDTVATSDHSQDGLGTSTKGIRVYNDNNGTTGDAVVAALKAINLIHKKQPILIVGGADKGLSLDVMESAITEMAKDVVYLAGTGTSRITLHRTHEFADLRDCVKKAFELAESGDVILFSPGFASFSSFFNNEYEKNDVFVEEVEKYRQALDARG